MTPPLTLYGQAKQWIQDTWISLTAGMPDAYPHVVHYLARLSPRQWRHRIAQNAPWCFQVMREHGHRLTEVEQQRVSRQVHATLVALREEGHAHRMGMVALDAPEAWRRVLWERPDQKIRLYTDADSPVVRLDEYLVLQAQEGTKHDGAPGEQSRRHAAYRNALSSMWAARPADALNLVLRELACNGFLRGGPDIDGIWPAHPMSVIVAKAMPALEWLWETQDMHFFRAQNADERFRKALAPLLRDNPGMYYEERLTKEFVDVMLEPMTDQVARMRLNERLQETVAPVPQALGATRGKPRI